MKTKKLETIENRLIHWRDDNSWPSDDFHHYFVEKFPQGKSANWCVIQDDARELANRLFDGEVEEESAVDGLYGGIAAASAAGAFAAMANALGTSTRVIEYVLDEYYWRDNRKAMSLDEFGERIKRGEQFFRDFESGKLDEKPLAATTEQSFESILFVDSRKHRRRWMRNILQKVEPSLRDITKPPFFRSSGRICGKCGLLF